MIQPAALTAAPALMPESMVPVECEESAEFATILGMHLNAITDGTTPAAILSASVLPEETGKPDGKSLPETSQLAMPASAEAESPHSGGHGEAAASVIVPLAVQLAQPAEVASTGQEISAQGRAPVRGSGVPVPEDTQADRGNLAQLLPDQTRQTPAAIPTPPRLLPSSADEAPRPTPVEPARISLPVIEGSSAPMTATPQLAFDLPAPLSNTPAAAAASARPQAPHDFATLVDRLVEARDTALAVQAPRAVTASLAHADFGDVAIRFEHRGDALSVALSSPDPDFARAVQAAAPAARADTGNDGNASPQRQDQQPGGSSSQSPQSQAQQRGTGSPSRSASPHERGDAPEHTRGGIFA